MTIVASVEPVFPLHQLLLFSLVPLFSVTNKLQRVFVIASLNGLTWQFDNVCLGSLITSARWRTV